VRRVEDDGLTKAIVGPPVTGAVRRAGATLVLALAVGSLGACGGSSSSSSTSSADQSAAKAVTSSGATNSTPVSSPAYRKLITIAASQRGLSPPIAARVADCVIKKETAQGYKTVADVAKDAASKQHAVQDAAGCTAEALPAG
jgi:hypothetical protein